MERTVINKLKEWKNKAARKPLLITGVRQCGKTYIIKKFGEENFEDYAYFNFDGNVGLSEIFEYDFNTSRILDELETLFFERKIDVGKTLVIFDEIQACPRAIMALKYFCEEKRELHIIAAGSLLGVALRKGGISFPVGKVDRLKMYPMSFEEFVRADGGEKYIEGIKKQSLDRELSTLYTIPMEKYLKNYYIIGGMPEVVQTWVDTHDYKKIEEIQDQILSDYADDFGKYASAETATRIRLIWDSIPSQIARENNKFIFSHVKKGARAKDLEDALEWLIASGIVYKLSMVATPQLPLSGMADYTYFKIYMADVGLLRRKSKINYRTIIQDEALFIHFKGALAENYVMTQLESMNINTFFWRTKADAEIDFITDYDGTLMPIEVKAADNTKAKSLQLFCKRYEPKLAIKVSLKNVGDYISGNTHVICIPLYALFQVNSLQSVE